MSKVQKLDLLIGVYFFCIVASELMGAKTFKMTTFSWMNLNASVALLLVPVIFSINDIITEVYGRERIRSLVRAGLLTVFLVFAYAAIATTLPPSNRYAPNEAAYDQIFQGALRISAASLTAFAIAELTDVLIFVKIREKMGKKALWLRNNASNFVAQFLDSTIFIFLAFYAFSKPFGENFTFLFGLIIPYWLLRCAMSVIETPFVYAGVKWLGKGK